MITIDELVKKIGTYPRVSLGHFPTPFHELERFSKALGGPRIFIKRDDCTGLAFGGNKTRMFEFLLARAKAEQAEVIVGGAGAQSNYSRQLAAASNMLGFETHLVLRRIRGARDNEIQGNLLLMLLAGARVHLIDAGLDEQRKAIYDLANELENKGKKVFVVRMAADEDLVPDVISYVNCYCEIEQQCQELGITPTYLYVSSYDSTQAGLEVGRAILDAPLKIRGIAPANFKTNPVELVTKYANQVASSLDFDYSFNTEEIYNNTSYVGKGYGIPTPESVEMIKLLARTEGIFVDPVYTSKVLAAIADHVKTGALTSKDTVVFLHSGGTPALFAYTKELDTVELEKFLYFE